MWRRGATSLVACIAVDRERALGEVMALLDGPLLRRDPGIAVAMMWGLGPVAAAAPEAADEVLDALALRAPITIAESLVELRGEVPGAGGNAVETCVDALSASLMQPELDDGLTSLAKGILEDLQSEGQGRELPRAVDRALEAFREQGTQQALTLATTAYEAAAQRLAELEAIDPSYHASTTASHERQRASALLGDLDAVLLQSRLLSNLLMLERGPGEDAAGVAAVDALDARLARWLLHPRRRSATPAEVKTQVTLLQQQLRTLLHLVDNGSTDVDDAHDRRSAVRSRWTETCRVLVARLREQPETPLARAIIATVARAFDALVRDGAAEPVDVLLYAAMVLGDPAHLAIVAEASMHPDITLLLQRYADFAAQSYRGTSTDEAKARIEAFQQLLDAFPAQTTLRAEAVRTAGCALVRALESVVAASSLRVLLPDRGGPGPLAVLEDAVIQLQQLVVGAERRCSQQGSDRLAIEPRRQALASTLEGAVGGESRTELSEALIATTRTAEATLPDAVAAIVTHALPRLATLTVDPPGLADRATARPAVPLPSWIPARRILGGFYVLHAIGGGNVSTVFVVTRVEDRHNPDAERFALKMPEYDATAARTTSEESFLKLFRQEAGALLAIPEHPNIVRFVTFDAGAKPKPILVMELVHGMSCERLIAVKSWTVARAMAVIGGVMAGLEVMHAAGVAHLDVKPSNVILQDDGQPVLVDFGLAGRKLRPGCATLCYGSPEIWEEADEAQEHPAPAADVYALGCFAYELLTAKTLFDGPTDVAIIASHITHDGEPPPIDAMAEQSALQPLAELLRRCLRHDPHERASIAELRPQIAEVAHSLRRMRWPLRWG